MAILVINSGSSSVKYALFDPETEQELHRGIFNGLDRDVLERIRRFNHLAPLHNPVCLQGIETALEITPQTPQVAVFDTGYFHSLPEYVWRYALPKDLARAWVFGTGRAMIMIREASRMW